MGRNLAKETTEYETWRLKFGASHDVVIFADPNPETGLLRAYLLVNVPCPNPNFCALT
jgi:hypothetical protein